MGANGLDSFHRASSNPNTLHPYFLVWHHYSFKDSDNTGLMGNSILIRCNAQEDGEEEQKSIVHSELVYPCNGFKIDLWAI